MVISNAAPSATGSDRANHIIDNLVDGVLAEFRSLRVWDERIRRSSTNPLNLLVTYKPINTSFVEVFDQNNNPIPANAVTLNANSGSLTVSTDDGQRDYFVTYEFNYFPSNLLKQFVDLTLAELNAASDQTAGVTNYTLDAAPSYFDGPLALGTIAKAFRKLATDSMLWKNYLIWQDGQTAQQLASQAAQEYGQEFNELKLGAKRGKFIAQPTTAYAAFRYSGFAGINSYSGKWRGLQVNRIGITVPFSGNP